MDFNFNYCSGKNALERAKRIQAATMNYLAEEKAKKEAEAEALNEANQRALMEGARFSNTSAYIRNKDKARRLQESLAYRDKTTKNAMTEYIFNIVESAFLIDKEEYEKLNPNYKAETKEMISSFLENAEINQNIKNKDTLALMEHISCSMPAVATGVLLEDVEVMKIINEAKNSKVDKAIENLSNDVEGKVADVVGKEQKKKKELQNNLDQVAKKTNKAVEEAEAEPVEEELPPEEEMAEEEPVEDEVPAEEMPVEEAPVEEELPPEEEPVEDEVPAEDEGVMSGRKETSIEVSPDGKIKIKTISEEMVTEIPKNGLLETLAVNEGVKMVKEGKEYNGDLALAKALNYITVLETFDAMGLINVDGNKINEIVRLGGGVEIK